MPALIVAPWPPAHPERGHQSGSRSCYACGERKPAGQVQRLRYYDYGMRNVCEDCFLDHADSGAFTVDEVTGYLRNAELISAWTFRTSTRSGMADFRTVKDRATGRRFSVRVAGGALTYVELLAPEAVTTWTEQVCTVLELAATLTGTDSQTLRVRQAARMLLERRPATERQPRRRKPA